MTSMGESLQEAHRPQGHWQHQILNYVWDAETYETMYTVGKAAQEAQEME